MKMYIKNTIRISLAFLFLAAMLTSCDYEEIAPADYPESLIYLPLAAYEGGIYTIDQFNESGLTTPTEGGTYAYILDKEKNQFEIPLSVYRSGLNPGGAASITISVNNDTLRQLIAEGMVTDVEPLPSGKYELVSSVQLGSGERLAPFSLVVDLDFLYGQAPQRYAMAISIASPEQKENPELSTVVVIIDTKIFVPAIEFATYVDSQDYKRITFFNTSEYVVAYEWDFGDGTTSREESPVHTYNADGVYEVTLKTIGLYGNVVTSNTTLTISEPVKKD
ncbi:MAG: PKD domain-containing protein [Candidatus Azobacteroides sp.]|nr:PKD domain-containing protein [Candidatus Azobacteroides sp.]